MNDSASRVDDDRPSTLGSAATRRDFLRRAAALGVAAAAAGPLRAFGSPLNVDVLRAPLRGVGSDLFSISLAEWSLHRALIGGKLDHLDFPKAAALGFGIDAVEYVNSFFREKAKPSYVAELKRRAADVGVTSVLIMCDGEGALGDPDEAKRRKAVDNHKPWLEAAKELGCGGIRVNAQSDGTPEEQRGRAAEGLRRLCEAADPLGMFVIVENHGGLSSNAKWLASVMKAVDHPRIGTLPDFGNFRVSEGVVYDRYEGVKELMPFAKGVSAKSYAFDAKGEETSMSFQRLIRLVVEAGYRGRIGIEYEGDAHSEDEGIKLTKALLERVRERLASEDTSRRTESRPASRPASRPETRRGG